MKRKLIIRVLLVLGFFVYFMYSKKDNNDYGYTLNPPLNIKTTDNIERNARLASKDITYPSFYRFKVDPYYRYRKRPKRKKSQKLKVKVYKHMVKGNLSTREIQKVLSKNIDQIKYCYEKIMLRKPDLKGKITVFWRINQKGKVNLIKIDSATLKNENINICIKNKIERWEFPITKNDTYTQVKYPFNFNYK